MPNLIPSQNRYQCEFCRTTYTSLSEARRCESGHDIVYVPMERADLKRFLLFLVTNDKALLSERLIRTFARYNGLKAE